MTCRANCCVEGCRNSKQDKKYSFFKLPLNKERCKLWLKIIGRPDLLQRNDLKPECHFVCSAHFDESMMIHKPLLKPNAVPTRYLPESTKDQRISATCTNKNQSTQTDDMQHYAPDAKVDNQLASVVEISLEPVFIKTEQENLVVEYNNIKASVAENPFKEIPATEATITRIADVEPSRKRHLKMENGRNLEHDLVKIKKEQ